MNFPGILGILNKFLRNSDEFSNREKVNLLTGMKNDMNILGITLEKTDGLFDEKTGQRLN